MPFETYATLLNMKIVVPSSKSNYVAVDRDYWMTSFHPKISDVDLNEDWYLKRYPDVASAVKSGVLSDAKQHYCESGYFENRLPYQINVDEKWYLANYGDVQTALAQKAFGSAQEHFEEVGFREGRLPFAGFALRKKNESAKSGR